MMLKLLRLSLLWLSVVGLLPASSAQVSPADGGPTVATIEARLSALDESGAAPEVVAEARAAWQAARTALDARADWRRQADTWRQSRAEAPAWLEQLRAELANWPELRAPRIPVDAPRSTLEAGLAEARAALTVAERDVADLKDLRESRARRRQEIPRRLAAARAQLEALRVAPEVSGQPLLDEARVALQPLQADVLQAEIEALEAELASHEARGELLAAREETAALRRTEAQKVVAMWQDRVDGRRVAEALAGRADAQAALAELPDDARVAVRTTAEANERIAARWVELAEALERSSGNAADLEERVSQLARRRTTVEARVEQLGFSSALAIALRRDRDELPLPEQLDRKSEDRRELGLAVQEDLLDWESERAELANLEGRIDALLAGDDAGEVGRERLRLLLGRRKQLLDEAAQDAEAWFARLLDLEDLAQRLAREAGKYRAFIDEHVLWVSDAVPIDGATLLAAARGALRLAGADALSSLAQGAGRLLKVRPGRSVPWFTVLIGLGLLRLFTTHRLRRLAEHVAARRLHGLGPMLAGVGLSIVASSVLPGVLLTLGALLGSLTAPSALVVAWSQGLVAAGWALWPVRLLAQLVRRSGVGTVHLHWADAAVRSTRRVVRPLTLLLPVSVGLAVAGSALAASGAGDDVSNGAALARLAVVASLLAGAAFVAFTLRPAGAVMTSGAQRNPRGLAVRTARLWWPLLWLAPLSLAVAGWVGFAYAATELGWRLLATGALLLLLLLVHGVIVRWLVLTRRKLRVEQVRRRMASADGSSPSLAEAGAAGPTSSGVEGASSRESDLDLDLVDAQARQLLSAVVTTLFALASLGLWSDVFPALGALDRVTVWQDEALFVAAESPDVVPVSLTPPADGAAGALASDAAPPAPGERVAAGRVSLSDLLAALLALALTWVAARNLPALLEVVLLGRSGIEAGLAYAITTLTRYVVTIVGVVVISGLLGISWGKVQWLVAAMTVGLGFGLQEIFANFVSGLILLFERPIRVGDIVTVGDTEGIVTRIRMRATVVRDWEWRELLVPNRDFITGRLVNWTLTDPRTRVTFPVGVAYGSDTALATRLLLEIAAEHEFVLADPAANVLFKDFGESSLDLQLRVWIASRDQFVQVKSEINARIHERFGEAGLVIPFPQRDLWVKSLPEGRRPDEG